MPSLLTQPRKKRKKPPCGRVIDYQVPRSPWQKLVDAARAEHGFTFRSLAAAISKAAGRKTSSSTVWIWIHAPTGVPHTRNFTPAHMAAFAKVLKIPAPQLERAFDASRHVFTAQENPTPQDSVDALDTFIRIMENDRRARIERTEVLDLARRLRIGTNRA